MQLISPGELLQKRKLDVEEAMKVDIVDESRRSSFGEKLRICAVRVHAPVNIAN